MTFCYITSGKFSIYSQLYRTQIVWSLGCVATYELEMTVVFFIPALDLAEQHRREEISMGDTGYGKKDFIFLGR